jgi:hypothetical protein
MTEQRMTADQRIDAHSLQIDARQLARKLLDQARDFVEAARMARDDAREILISVGMDEEEIEEVFKDEPMQ